MSAVWSRYSYRGDALVPSNTGTPGTKAGADVGRALVARVRTRLAGRRQRVPRAGGSRPAAARARRRITGASAASPGTGRGRLRLGGRCGEARGPSRRAERGRAPAIGGRARRDRSRRARGGVPGMAKKTQWLARARDRAAGHVAQSRSGTFRVVRAISRLHYRPRS